MNDLNTIHGARLIIPFVATPPLAHEGTTAQPSKTQQSKSAQSQTTSPSDRVEFSSAATQLADSLAGSEIRVDKVARVRSEVQNGLYDVTGKMEAVLDRILDDLA